MKTENVKNSLITLTGTVAGGMASRVVADSIPLKKDVKDKEGNLVSISSKKQAVKHGALAVLATLGAVFLDRKSKTQAFVQDVAIGFSAVQANYAVKELVKEPKGTFKTALGCPSDGLGYTSYYEDAYDFIPQETIDTTFEDVTETTSMLNFRQ